MQAANDAFAGESVILKLQIASWRGLDAILVAQEAIFPSASGKPVVPLATFLSGSGIPVMPRPPDRPGAGALAGLVTGIGVNTFFLTYPQHAPIAGLHEGIYGLAANVAVFVTVSLLTRPQAAERVRIYVEA